MNLFSLLPALGLLPAAAAPAAQSPSAPLVVVEDRGGVSAWPYYQALGLQPPRAPPSPAPALVPQPPARGSEADMLPVRSTLLSPGDVPRRVIQAPGLAPLFLVGDDPRSRAWLQQRLPVLRALGAAGLVVNVASPDALAALRRLAPGLTLTPASGDDLARRLGLRLGLHHYPVLVTATGIEQ